MTGIEIAALSGIVALASAVRWRLAHRGGARSDNDLPRRAPALGAYRRAEIGPRLEMIEIAPATFLMASAKSGAEPFDPSHPAHAVSLSRYWISMLPVTQKLYRELMGQSPGSPEGDDLPVNRVSFEDAIRFCNRLSDLEGFTPAYRIDGGSITWLRNAEGYRLPSEAEWEYAARGPDGRPYPWGSALPSNQLCWNGDGNDLGRGRRRAPSPVSAHPEGASPFGVLEMAGNVAEWCWDWYGLYGLTHGPDPDPTGPPYGCLRIIRGGSWDDADAASMHVAARDKLLPTGRYDTVGFRCARGVPEWRAAPRSVRMPRE